MAKLNWWAGVRLWRAASSPLEADELVSRGQLCEMLARALEFAPADRQNLFITYELTNRRLTPVRMQELISRPDFPIFI